MQKINKILLLILFILFIGCDCNQNLSIKPFIIINKYPNSQYCSKLNKIDNVSVYYTRYTYEDYVGNTVNFCELRDKYNIGDTIK